MILLVDMDGPLANWEQGFLDIWLREHEEFIPLEDRRDFYVTTEVEQRWGPVAGAEARSIAEAPGFYRDLPEVDGAADALNEMVEMGHTVRICTSPIFPWQHCVGEKFDWVDDHLGIDWVKRIVLTKDKTVVRGDVLIDDKPVITGEVVPLWTHVHFDAPYNRHVTDGLRVRWTDGSWRTVIDGLASGPS